MHANAPSPASNQGTRLRRVLFWAVLVGFIGWDLSHADPVNVRLEPPIIAAGSGQAVSGGHCALPK